MPRTTTLPKADILARYAAGETARQLAVTYNRHPQTMLENLHRWGAEVRRTGPARIYSLDESFFRKVDSELKAYWLGFLLADGGVDKRGFQLRVELARSDEGHLYKLASALSTDAIPAPGHDGESAVLTTCSAQLCRDLVRHGCIPAKTGIHGTPRVPKRLYRHLYRGYTDGDGSIFYSVKNYSWCYDATGAPRFIEDYQRWLMANAGVEQTKLTRRKCTSTVRYSGSIQVERICRLLYGNANIFLDRKYAAYRLVASRPGAQLRIVG